jgi:hypothetical protein
MFCIMKLRSMISSRFPDVKLKAILEANSAYILNEIMTLKSVFCPQSNVFLYSETPRVTPLKTCYILYHSPKVQ